MKLGNYRWEKGTSDGRVYHLFILFSYTTSDEFISFLFILFSYTTSDEFIS